MHHVLVVEDAALVRGLIRDVLRREGYVVHEAFGARDALQRFVEVEPDVVTLDIALPDGSGLDLANRLRRIRTRVPFAVVSALRAEEAALSAGAAAFVPKPFTPAQLAEAVRVALASGAGPNPVVVRP